MLKKNKPFYYQCVAPIDNLSEAELNEVLINSRAIGLPDFDAYDIKSDEFGFSYDKKY
jgi:hypothetical protein